MMEVSLTFVVGVLYSLKDGDHVHLVYEALLLRSSHVSDGDAIKRLVTIIQPCG